MKRLFCILLFPLIIISCQLNPFVGVGSTIDTVAPVLHILSPGNFSYESGDMLNLCGDCSDNVKVTSIVLKVEHDGQTLFTSEIKNPDSLWSYKIRLNPKADITAQLKGGTAAEHFELPDGEYKFTVFAHDANGNTSNNSYDTRTLVIDNEPSVAEITYPPLKSSLTFYTGETSRGEAAADDAADPYDFNNSDYFRNGEFYIQGNIDDNYGVKSLTLTLTEYNESGEAGKALSVKLDSSMKFTVASDIDERLLTVDESKAPASLWNWKIWFKETAKTLDDKTTPRYYSVGISVEDSAGNEERSEKGFLCVLPKMDYPYTVFPKYGEKIPVKTPLSGTCYDDDGIKSVKLSLCNAAGEVIAGKEDVYGENEIDGAKIFAWKMQNSIPTNGGAYTLKVEVVDVNGKKSSDTVDGTVLHDAQYRESALTVVDVTAPSVNINAKKGTDETAKEVDFDVYTDVVAESGDFQVSVKVTDASQVCKVYLARVLKSAVDAGAAAKLNEIDAQSGNVNRWDVSSDVTGIKFYKLYEYSSGEASKEITRAQSFNVYDDFDGEFDKKWFYVYAENASGKTTVSYKTLQKEEEHPQVMILSPEQGSDLTVPFNISCEVEDSTGITELTIECSQNREEEKFTSVDLFKLLNLKKDKPSENKKISINSLSSNEFGEADDFASGLCALTFTAIDSYGNKTTEKRQFYIDKNAPFIRKITATTGTYKTGDTIEIRMEVSKPVTVTGAPMLTLNNGGTATFERFEKIDNENNLIFKYEVEVGQGTACLNCDALVLNNARIVDAQNTHLETGTFPTKDESGALEKSAVEIDTTPPTVSSIKSLTPAGSYTVGEKIEIQVTFSENVEIAREPRPRLRLNIKDEKDQSRYAEYDSEHSGNSGDKAIFVYTVQSGDNTDCLTWEGWDKNGAEITDLATAGGGKGNPFAFEKSDNWEQKLIIIDTTSPQVQKISAALSGGTYYCNEGRSINLDVTFSEKVKVEGTPSLSLNCGKTTAAYQSGSGSKNGKLRFTYTVAAGDNTAKLAVTGISGVIKDEAGNTLDLSGLSGTIDNAMITIDTTPPGKPTLSATKNPNVENKEGVAVYTELTADDKTVGVTIRAQAAGIAADTDSYCWEENGITGSYSTYTPGTTIEKTFGNGKTDFYQQYNVRLKLKDKAGNESDFSDAYVFIIDTSKPKVTKASSSAVVNDKLETSTSRTYIKDEKIYISLVFNKNVTVISDVTVTLNNEKTVTLAAAGTATTRIKDSADYYLTGTYTVVANETLTKNLQITAVTGTVKDDLNNVLDLTTLNDSITGTGFENIDSFQEIKIDSVAPQITSVSSSTADDWYNAGKFISVTVTFSEAVEFVGTNPTLTLSNDGKAEYVNGSGTNSWIFSYEVKSGEDTGDSSKDTSFLTAKAITGEIRDLAGEQNRGNLLNAAMPTDNNFKDKKIGIDTTPPGKPTLSAVYSVNNKLNKLLVGSGETFSGMNGNACITVSCASNSLEDGAVVYITENGTAKSNWEAAEPEKKVECKPGAGEVLTYTIAAKQRDKAGNVSEESSITFTIDDSPITLERIDTTTASGVYGEKKEIPITLTFNKEVEITNALTLTLNNNATPVTIEKELTATYKIAKGDDCQLLNVSELAGTVTDELGASLDLSKVDFSKIINLAANKQITIDTTHPKITGITTTAADGWYNAGKIIRFTMECDEDVKAVGAPALTLLNGGEAVYASGSGSNKLVFNYPVGSGDSSTTDKSLSITGLSGTVQDIAGNALAFSEFLNDSTKNKSFGIGIDTKAPGKLTIGGITNKSTVITAKTLTISGFGDTGGSGIKSYTITINGTPYEVAGNASGTLAFTELPDAIQKKLTVADGGQQLFTVSAYQTDNAGNKSDSSDPLEFKIDTNQAKLLSVTANKNNQICKEGETVKISLVFSRAITSGSPVITLSNNVTLNSGSWSKDGLTYTATYTIGNVASEDTGGTPLTITKITGSIDDGLGVLNMEGLWSNTAALNLSSNNIIIDTVSPTAPAPTANYTNGTATLTYTFSENVQKVAGKKITLTRTTKAAPIVLSVSEYNELSAQNSSIATYYEKTINGCDSNGKVDSTAKYVLKYEYGPTEAGLIDILSNIGYYTQEIVMESSAVTVSGNTVTVTISGLMTGETYSVATEAGIVKDSAGHECGKIDDIPFNSGDTPQAPVIRVNKISGRGTTAASTTMRIDTVTSGATIYYSAGSSFTTTPATTYSSSGSVTWRGTTYNGVVLNDTSCISAQAKKEDKSSATSYEKAFRTVIKTSPNTTESGANTEGVTFYVFRGGDQPSGSNSVSVFPMSWDEKSVSPTNSTVGEALEKELAKYGMLLAENMQAITWGVTEKLHFHGLGCKVEGGKLQWRWQEQTAVPVSAGGTGIDMNRLEGNFHAN